MHRVDYLLHQSQTYARAQILRVGLTLIEWLEGVFGSLLIHSLARVGHIHKEAVALAP